MNRPGHGSVIELLGAPGSGKSSLAVALSAFDGVTVVKDHSRGDLSALVWSTARSWPVALAAPPDVDRLRWAAWTGRVSAAPAIARHRFEAGSSMVVFDQGAAYTLACMAGLRGRRPGNGWWWRRTLQTAQMLDVLVILDADTHTLAERIRSRDKEHEARHLPSPELCGYLTVQRRAVHSIADVLSREGADVRRIVTSETSPTEQVDLVLEAAASHLAHRG